ncbi:hypothetical protein COP00_06995 [Bacillus glycinifermentans]|uniref:Uncharacterized protein n=1 Tax=Bacillus glycinifermentans TaxID=1664069 RepID=A0A0T6BU21_9BACI|nr:hypothetical protein COP00_06995 [Bacillus glycinifermentans]KRT95144.1 hypothetical protein AB447_211560 [Bacillus glycinifermentans]
MNSFRTYAPKEDKEKGKAFIFGLHDRQTAEKHFGKAYMSQNFWLNPHKLKKTPGIPASIVVL